jgi:hypothetical protein
MLGNASRPGTISVGKIGELHVFRELLRRGVNPYVPLVDIEGVDAVIKTKSGDYLELQIKTVATEKTPRWFQVQKLRARHNYYVVCVVLTVEPIETWIVPSLVFERHSTVDKSGLCDLNFDSTARGSDVPRWKLLDEYRDAWHLLSGEAVIRPVESAEAFSA